MRAFFKQLFPQIFGSLTRSLTHTNHSQFERMQEGTYPLTPRGGDIEELNTIATDGEDRAGSMKSDFGADKCKQNEIVVTKNCQLS